jgi:hypothetical protein
MTLTRAGVGSGFDFPEVDGSPKPLVLNMLRRLQLVDTVSLSTTPGLDSQSKRANTHTIGEPSALVRSPADHQALPRRLFSVVCSRGDLPRDVEIPAEAGD